MTSPRVSKPSYQAAEDKLFGPATIEHRTAGCGLSELGTYFMVFKADDQSDPWTVQYEETIYVIEGQARLVVLDEGGESDIVGDPGELIVLPKGATVRYGGAPGTRLLLSISPVNWRERQG
jgi:ethanolamine utilization protein EutQ (cupin superfamily)